MPRAFATLLSTKNRQPIASVTCDSDGRFAFEGLPAGKYSLTASKRGFLAAFYNEHEQFNSAIVTGEGQQTEDLILRLKPEASLQVDVTGEAGDPVEKAKFMLFLRHTAIGSAKESSKRQNHHRRERLAAFLQSAARRIFSCGHRPALVRHAWPGHACLRRGGQNVNPALDVAYPVTFFDSVTDEASATPIVLAAGAARGFPSPCIPCRHCMSTCRVPEGQEDAFPHAKTPPAHLRHCLLSGGHWTSLYRSRTSIAEFIGVASRPLRAATGRSAAHRRSGRHGQPAGSRQPPANPRQTIHVTLRNANGSALPDKLQLSPQLGRRGAPPDADRRRLRQE